MPEFLTLLPPYQALDLFLRALPIPHPPSEDVETASALNRVTAEAISSPFPLPAFPRSTVDGYAVRAADTYGASESLPAYLVLVGDVPMGAQPGFSLSSGQAALIHTGGMLPEGADAVVMLEQTQTTDQGELEVLRAVGPNENVILPGEDVRQGEVVIPAGVRLRPAVIGGLMALGISRLRVTCRPRIAILSSGDEVVPPDAQPTPGQVRDINSYSLSALVEEAGARPVRYGIIPDRASALQSAVNRALEECEAVVITAGSSASARDMTAQAIQGAGEPGVLVHGVNVRPGKPTILGVCGQKAVVGLPGNPVSALVIARLFILPLIERLSGVILSRPKPVVTARLAINLASQAGREDWIPARLLAGEAGLLTEPIFFKSNLIFSLARADGLIFIPADATGISAGESVQVYLI